MSILAGMFTGTLLGCYFAEKNVPFPLAYNRRPDGRTGSLSLDLQIVDVVINDVKTAVGYGAPSNSLQ